MGFSDFVNKAKDLASEHDEQVDQGLDRGGDMAKERFAGHEGQIDSVVDRAQQYTGEGDTTAVAPAEGGDPAQEAPGGPQVEVPAGPGEVPPQQ
jgi:MT0933-like antitoxin protein